MVPEAAPDGPDGPGGPGEGVAPPELAPVGTAGAEETEEAAGEAAAEAPLAAGREAEDWPPPPPPRSPPEAEPDDGGVLIPVETQHNTTVIEMETDYSAIHPPIGTQ